MSQLNKDLFKQLHSYQDIITKCNNIERNYKELKHAFNNLKQTNESLKGSEKIYSNELENLRQICATQENEILRLLNYETKSDKLSEEIMELNRVICELKAELKDEEQERKLALVCQNAHHAGETEKLKNFYERTIGELKDKLELVQATSDLQENEQKNEMNKLRDNYEGRLKETQEKEQQLREALIDQNNQMLSSSAVYYKKIHELEQKVKTLEREKAMFTASKGNFISAQSVLNVCTNSSETNHPVNPTKQSQIQEAKSWPQRSVVAGTKNENTSQKRFHFRKMSATSSEASKNFPRSLSSSQNVKPQEISQQNLNSSFPKDQFHELFEEPTFKPVVKPTQEPQKSTDSDSQNDCIQVVFSGIKETETQSSGSKTDIISSKRRKLFNPNNFSYLE